MNEIGPSEPDWRLSDYWNISQVNIIKSPRCVQESRNFKLAPFSHGRWTRDTLFTGIFVPRELNAAGHVSDGGGPCRSSSAQGQKERERKKRKFRASQVDSCRSSDSNALWHTPTDWQVGRLIKFGGCCRNLFFFILIRWSTLSLCPTLTFSHLSVVSLFFFKTKF